MQNPTLDLSPTHHTSIDMNASVTESSALFARHPLFPSNGNLADALQPQPPRGGVGDGGWSGVHSTHGQQPHTHARIRGNSSIINRVAATVSAFCKKRKKHQQSSITCKERSNLKKKRRREGGGWWREGEAHTDTRPINNVSCLTFSQHMMTSLL